MKKYYYDGDYMWEIKNAGPKRSLLMELYESRFFYWAGYVFGWFLSLAPKFAVGFGIGLLIKAIFRAIF